MKGRLSKKRILGKNKLFYEIEKETELAMAKDDRSYCDAEKEPYYLDEAIENHDKIAKRILEVCNIKGGSDCLDDGCGFGDLLFSLSKYFKTVQGVDPTESFIKVCNKKKNLFKTKNVHFQCVGGEVLPFPDESFDLVVSKTVLEHVANVGDYISEVSRVLRKGGKFYLECPNYRWFSEGHYLVFMLPMMPKFLFRPYLRLRGRNPTLINSINYVNPSWVEKEFKKNNLSFKNITFDYMRDVFSGKESIADTHPSLNRVGNFLKKVGLASTSIKTVEVLGTYPAMIYIAEKTSAK